MSGHSGTPDRRPVGGDGGFTLVELLVVMVIIGILAGIAVPIFLSQRGKAVDSNMKADLRNLAAAMEDHYAGNQAYAAPTQSGRAVSIPGGDTVTVSEGTTITVSALASATAAAGSWAAATGYCITATNPRGKVAGGVKFNSLAGGATTSSCP